MIYLIWGLFYFGVFIFFISVIIEYTKPIQKKYGRLVAILLILGFFSFFNKSKDGKNKVDWQLKNTKKLDFKASNHIKIDLDHSYFAKNTLDIFYGIEKETNKKIATSAYSMREGIVLGINWKPKSIYINNLSHDTFKYHVGGVLEWKILGMVVYPQLKNYDGKIKIPQAGILGKAL